MRRITTLTGPPQSFVNWLEENKDVIQDKLEDRSVTGDNIWAFFKNNKDIYDDLKKVLVEDQGFICCYCGQSIKNDHNTLIEHLRPKSKFKNLTLIFTNLFASCQGGSKNVIHLVKKDESLSDIATSYGVDIGHIEEVYVSVDEERLFRQKYDLENLSAGDRIVIFPLLTATEQHCDTNKKNNEISITPLQDDCSSNFSYNLLSGKVNETDINSSTIKILGLNLNTYLNRLRKKTIDTSIILKKQLITDFGHSKEEFEANRVILIDKLSKISEFNPQLRPFIFVTIWSLNN